MIEPVTQTLVEQLRRTLVSYPIVVWLDKDGHYTQFVDALGADAPARVGAPVLAYRGSYLELMRSLAQMTDGVDPSPLLVHVPGANQESIKDTPLLELNETGYQFRKGLETLIREAAAGRVTPEEVDGFLASGDPVSLASADAWMAKRVAAADDKTEILLRGTDPGRLIAELVSKGPLEHELPADALSGVWHYLATQTGLPDRWPTAERRSWAQQQPKPDEAGDVKRRLADLAAAWVLCVEYVHDLQRPPIAALLEPAKTLARPLIDACRAAAEHLRTTATAYYVTLADDLEDQIEIECTSGEADELGRIDTFRFEEDRLLKAALEAVHAHEWAQAAKWAGQRLAGESVWLDVDPPRRRAWELIDKAARLGSAIAGSPLSFADARNIDEATRRYVEHGAAIDALHREFEQLAERDLLSSSLPHAELVRRAVVAVRACWRGWAETAAQQWSRVCEEEGPLPDASLQQRHVFEQVVAPLLDGNERTALFLVDAMRYEMGQQLRELIGEQAGTTVRLSARLAELPTRTEIGMNVLVPTVQRGRLIPLFDGKRRRIEGFDAGGFKVKDRPQRETLLGRSAGGVRWFEIDELLGSDASLAHQIAKARLVVVHSIQIDKAGEVGLGVGSFPGELRRVHMAWQLLRTVGIRRFVFTSDHGFLLRSVGDEEIQHGQGYDALPRYALYPSVVSNDRQLGLSLRSLEYEAGDEAVVVPRGLAVYQSGRDRKFVHGGNSPQERVIPVLTLVHRHAAGGEDQHYRVEIEEEVGGSTFHSLRGRVIRADHQTTLALDVEPIELELRAADGSGVIAEPLECDGATLEAGLITAKVGDDFRLRFRLSSTQEQRVRVELASASAKRRVDPAISPARFDVLAPAAPPPKPVETPAPISDVSWLEEFEDPGVRRVMAHIVEHGEVTEADLVSLLGNNQRKARQFARNFEVHRARAKILIEIGHGPTGKVYKKVTDK
jgi:hypothetical protein